jgi:hypothetical protein
MFKNKESNGIIFKICEFAVKNKKLCELCENFTTFAVKQNFQLQK